MSSPGRSTNWNAKKGIALNTVQTEDLYALLSQPAAPFREHYVKRYIAAFCDRAHVPYFEDDVGNIVVGVDSRPAYRRVVKLASAEPLRIFVAHMDHPGCHGVRWRGDQLMVRWLGGSPVKHLRGAKLWLATDEGIHATARLEKAHIATHGRAIESATLAIDSGLTLLRSVRAADIYGGFSFRAPVWKMRDRLYTKAADDLVGVFSILQTAAWWFAKRRTDPMFLGLLTRAEEVGFVGAVEHFELGWWRAAKRPLLGVSLEASRTLPGALVGGGPVVRLGDRRTVFDANGLQVLTQLAQQHLRTQFQRRVMDGGACEGTAMTAYGIPTIAMSVPLGNYHNQGFEGGPDCRVAEGPAPEFVHVDDIRGMLKLCRAVMTPRVFRQDSWRPTRENLLQNARSYRHLL